MGQSVQTQSCPQSLLASLATPSSLGLEPQWLLRSLGASSTVGCKDTLHLSPIPPA
jgi:hypothetical protein